MTPSSLIINDKSRKQSIFQFFEALQFEWICNDLREIIYPYATDKLHWKIVKDGKKVKIENIAIKNNLPTIFDDEEMMSTLKQKIYRTTGLPNFLYKDNRQRATQEYYDMLFFFHKGIDVRIDIAGEVVVCKITHYKPYEMTLCAKRLDNSEPVVVDIKECARIM